MFEGGEFRVCLGFRALGWGVWFRLLGADSRFVASGANKMQTVQVAFLNQSIRKFLDLGKLNPENPDPHPSKALGPKPDPEIQEQQDEVNPEDATWEGAK